MAAATTRRPLPALAFLLALAVLASIVWWRVIHRSDEAASNAAAPTCTTAVAVSTVPQQSSVTVRVYNATTHTGLAARVAAALTKQGFRIGEVANDPKQAKITGVAEIRFGTSAKTGATLMSYYVPGAKLVPVERVGAEVDLALGDKYSAVATLAQVKAALQRDHLKQEAVRPRGLPATPTPRVPTPTRTAC